MGQNAKDERAEEKRKNKREAVQGHDIKKENKKHLNDAAPEYSVSGRDRK